MLGRAPWLIILALTAAVFGTPNQVAARKPTKHHAASHHTECQTIGKTEVIALFERWNKALATKRPETVVAEYAPDATLLPTVQTGPLIGTEAIQQYFNDFLKKSPQAEVNARAIRTACNIAYDIGLYTFTIDGDEPGSRKQVKARFTYIYAPVQGKWLIMHQHSSIDPVTSE